MQVTFNVGEDAIHPKKVVNIPGNTIANLEQFEAMFADVGKKDIKFWLSHENEYTLVADHEGHIVAVRRFHADESLVFHTAALIRQIHKRVFLEIEPETSKTADDIYEWYFERVWSRWGIMAHKAIPSLDWRLGIYFQRSTFLAGVIFINLGRITIRIGMSK